MTALRGSAPTDIAILPNATVFKQSIAIKEGSAHAAATGKGNPAEGNKSQVFTESDVKRERRTCGIYRKATFQDGMLGRMFILNMRVSPCIQPNAAPQSQGFQADFSCEQLSAVSTQDFMFSPVPQYPDGPNPQTPELWHHVPQQRLRAFLCLVLRPQKL